MGEKFGIEELKDIISFGAELGNGLGKSLEDDKITLGDAVNFIPALTAIPSAISGFSDVKKELDDLDEAEKEELLSYFRNKFDIPQEQTEAFVEDALKIAVTIYEFAKTWFF